MNREIDPWGRVKLHSEDAVELLMRNLHLTDLAFEPDEAITQYNETCRRHDKLAHLIPTVSDPPITPEQDTQRRIATWLIPQDYQTRDVRQHLLSLCQRSEEVTRVQQEMDLFEQHGLMPVLRLMMFLVDQFREHDIVWGVGRGSSVASYCLFLIGLHKIDALAFNLPIEEFLR